MDYKIRESNKTIEEALQPEMPGGELWLARLIGKRVDHRSELKYYLNKGRANMPDPHSLLNVKEAASHIAEMIENVAAIGVVCDFDADGIGSLCIIEQSFIQFGYSNYTMIIPDRMKENHGLNCNHVDRLNEIGVKTILTADNGSSCQEAITYAISKGMKTIVTDHHEVPDPDMDVFLMVNPRSPKDTLGDEDLCGAGIAFLLMQAVAKKLNFDLDTTALLQYCAISTMADVVPLTANNRAIVQAGVELMRAKPIPFVEAACELHNLDCASITATDLSWKFAPMLNAASRIEKAEYAAAALMAVGERAFRAANYLFECNKRRSLMMSDIIDNFNPTHQFIEKSCSVYCVDDWHLGITGLIAGIKAREEGKVVGCGAKDKEGNWRISFRSPGEGADISGAILKTVNEGLALGGGGHDGAGGSALKHEHLADFSRSLSEGLSDLNCVSVVDGKVDPDWWSVEKIEDMNHFMQPFGRANPSVTMFWQGRVSDIKVLKGKHVKMKINGVNAIAFGMADMVNDLKKHDAHVIYEPSINEWRGEASVQAMVTKMEVAS